MDPAHLTWRKSIRSGSSGNCVEVATPSQIVMVRDSKDRQGPVLSFGAGQWTSFVQRLKTGGF